MSIEGILAIFVPAFLALLLALGGVFVFRGNYYKSLAGRVDELEERDTKNYQENQRLRAENETLRRIVTGEIALEQLVELARKHEIAADRRQAKILETLLELKGLMEHG